MSLSLRVISGASKGAITRMIRWEALWIVGACVRINYLSSSPKPRMTSLDFLYRISVFLPLISRTTLALKIRPWCLLVSNYSNRKTLFIIRASISVLSDILNSLPGVVIFPAAFSSYANSISTFSLLIINAAVVLSSGMFTEPLGMFIEPLGDIFIEPFGRFFEPFGRPRPLLIGGGWKHGRKSSSSSIWLESKSGSMAVLVGEVLSAGGLIAEILSAGGPISGGEFLSVLGSRLYGLIIILRKLVGLLGIITVISWLLIVMILNRPVQCSFSRHTRTSSSGENYSIVVTSGPFLILRALRIFCCTFSFHLCYLPKLLWQKSSLWLSYYRPFFWLSHRESSLWSLAPLSSDISFGLATGLLVAGPGAEVGVETEAGIEIDSGSFWYVSNYDLSIPIFVVLVDIPLVMPADVTTWGFFTNLDRGLSVQFYLEIFNF